MLRNFASLLFVILLFLNVLGYYGFFLGLKHRNDVSMSKRLDANTYDNSEAITIKLPIAVPYATESRGFERVDGQFEYHGEFYRLVKQKLSQDTLYIICIRDRENKEINHALSSIVKTFSDNATDNNSHAKVTSNFIKDYLSSTFSMKSLTSGWESDIQKGCRSTFLTPSYCSSIVHPPERA